MRMTTIAAVGVCLLVGVCRAFAGDPTTIDVWAEKPPGDVGAAAAAPEQWQGKRVTNVSHPTLEIFRPEKEKDSGVAVIVCPGGGYKALMMDYEGEDVARWLNTIGVTGIVLKYRLPAPEGTPKYLPALQDAQRSVSLVRSKAKEWGLDEHRIGMLGFSAGAHLTAATSTNFDRRAYAPADAVDKVSCRPDFAIVVYPGGVVQKSAEHAATQPASSAPATAPAGAPDAAEGELINGRLAPEIRPTSQTPPTFICQANDDRVNAENSVFYYLALKRAGVPVELHIYAAGGHGFGIRATGKPVASWPERCAEWMKNQGILKSAS